jgi:hypothetical protein
MHPSCRRGPKFEINVAGNNPVILAVGRIDGCVALSDCAA